MIIKVKFHVNGLAGKSCPAAAMQPPCSRQVSSVSSLSACWLPSVVFSVLKWSFLAKTQEMKINTAVSLQHSSFNLEGQGPNPNSSIGKTAPDWDMPTTMFHCRFLFRDIILILLSCSSQINFFITLWVKDCILIQPICINKYIC